MEQHLDWNVHTKNIIPKLNRVLKFLLKAIYYSLFNSYLIYVCQGWGQNKKYL